MSYESIQDKIQANEFENKLPYPTSETLTANAEHIRLTEEIKELKQKVEDLREERKSILTDMRVAYNTESQELVRKFRVALEVSYELQNHPNRDKIWRKAWDDGHSGGYGEVLNEYDELAQLLL